MSHKLKVKAFQLTREAATRGDDWPLWLEKAWYKSSGEIGRLYPLRKETKKGRFAVTSTEGVVHVAWNDWIIKGINGELHVCKPDVFEEAYELGF